jgi:hypothetical protein
LRAAKAHTMALPMVIDGGVGGLEQSFHHPLAGLGAQNTDTPANTQQTSGHSAAMELGTTQIQDIADLIVGLVDNERKEDCRKAVARLIQAANDRGAAEQRERSGNAATATLTKDDIKALIREVTQQNAPPPPPIPPGAGQRWPRRYLAAKEHGRRR